MLASGTIVRGILLIINGIGRLWFLPMIFWCFVINYILEKNGLCKPWLMLVFLVCATYNLLFKLPLGLGSVPTYYLFFYVGFMMGSKRIKLPMVNMWLPATLFLTAFSASMFIKDNIEATTLIEKGFLLGLNGLVNIIISVTGVYLLYRIANIPKIQNKIYGNNLLIELSGCCYGVYIFQQFILKFLYYKSDMAQCINPYALPWLATL